MQQAPEAYACIAQRTSSMSTSTDGRESYYDEMCLDVARDRKTSYRR
jgi:hypothetical protein